jgi:hypothetical protein
MYFVEGTLVILPFVSSVAGFSLALIASDRLADLPAAGRLRDSRWAAPLLACSCAVTAGVALRGDFIPNNWDAAGNRWYAESAFDRTLNRWLAQNAQPAEILLAPVWPRSAFQVSTGHPILIDIDTLMTMTYMHSMAPAVNVLVRDLFAIDFADREFMRRVVGADGMLRPTSPVWLESWKARTEEEWRGLGTKYQFRLVLSPKSTPLNLPVAIEGPVWTLYTVPAASDGREGSDVKGA